MSETLSKNRCELCASYFIRAGRCEVFVEFWGIPGFRGVAHQLILLGTVIAVEPAQIAVIEPGVIEHESARLTLDEVHAKGRPVPGSGGHKWRDESSL